MTREVGTKTFSLSPSEIAQFGLEGVENMGDAVRKKLSGTDILSMLPQDVREYVALRADGLGCAPADIVGEALRAQMQAIFAKAAA